MNYKKKILITLIIGFVLSLLILPLLLWWGDVSYELELIVMKFYMIILFSIIFVGIMYIIKGENTYKKKIVITLITGFVLSLMILTLLFLLDFPYNKIELLTLKFYMLILFSMISTGIVFIIEGRTELFLIAIIFLNMILPIVISIILRRMPLILSLWCIIAMVMWLVPGGLWGILAGLWVGV